MLKIWQLHKICIGDSKCTDCVLAMVKFIARFSVYTSVISNSMSYSMFNNNYEVMWSYYLFVY